MVLVLVFHFLLFGNLTLILYFLFLPQADMDSLEGNDTPKSSHKPFHQSHTLHTHHKKGPLRWHGHSVGIPPSPGHLTTAHLSSGDHVVMPSQWVSAVTVIGHFLGQCPSKQSIQNNCREPCEPLKMFPFFPSCFTVAREVLTMQSARVKAMETL